MTPDAPATPLVLLAGPIAAGKSAVSRRLAASLRENGLQLALVELDAIADMARPTLPDWADAHRIFASVIGQWLQSGLDVVIAESVSDRHELDTVLRAVPAGTPVLTAAVTCSVEIALERALADPTRGVSRDPAFLRGAHARWDQDLLVDHADVVLDSGTTSIDESVQTITDAVAAFGCGNDAHASTTMASCTPPTT